MSKVRIVPRTTTIENKSKKRKSKVNKMTKKELKLLRQLSKEMKKDAQIRKCRGFMHEKLENIVLFDEDKKIYRTIKGKLSKRGLARLGKGLDNAQVLINSGQGYYKRMPFSLYKSLCKIRYMVVNITVTIQEDGVDDSYVAYEEEINISSLNQLLNYIRSRDGLLAGLNKYHTGMGWYSYTEVIEKSKILYKKNTVKKMDFDDFIYKYKLY